MSSYDLAVKITNRLILESGEEEYQKNKDWYRYGIEIILTTVGGAFTILLIAMVLGIGKSVLAYVLPFCLLRAGMGGQHAKTHSKCITYFIGIMLAVIIFAKVLVINNVSVIGIMVLACYNLLLLLYLMYSDTGKNNIVKRVGRTTAWCLNILTFICLLFSFELSGDTIIALGALAVEMTSVRIKEKNTNEKYSV